MNVIPNLPSPYYHFDYDETGRTTEASFASGLTMYDITYDRGRIAEMRNNSLGDRTRLVYGYDNAGRVTTIDYVNESGQAYTVVSLTYAGQKLQRLDHSRLLGGAFVLDKTTTGSTSMPLVSCRASSSISCFSCRTCNSRRAIRRASRIPATA